LPQIPSTRLFYSLQSEQAPTRASTQSAEALAPLELLLVSVLGVVEAAVAAEVGDAVDSLEGLSVVEEESVEELASLEALPSSGFVSGGVEL